MSLQQVGATREQPPLPSPEDHPSLEVLLAYHDRLLEEPAAESVRDHLGRCRRCADLVLARVEFEEPLEEGRKPSELERRWFQRAVLQRAKERWKVWPAWTVAAGLAASIAGLLLWRSEMPARDLPAVVNLPVLEVILTSDQRGEPEILTLSPAVPYAAFVVACESLELYREYRVELVGSKGQLLWKEDGLVPGRYGALTFGLSTALLDRHGMVLRALGLRHGQATLLSERAIEIRDATGQESSE